MTTAIVIVLLKLAIACLQWPTFLTRIGSWIVALANLVGRAFVREPAPEFVLPTARVVRR